MECIFKKLQVILTSSKSRGGGNKNIYSPEVTLSLNVPMRGFSCISPTLKWSISSEVGVTAVTCVWPSRVESDSFTGCFWEGHADYKKRQMLWRGEAFILSLKRMEFFLFIYLFLDLPFRSSRSLSISLFNLDSSSLKKKKKRKRFWETSLRDNPLFSSEDNSVLFHWSRKTNSAMVFKGSLFQLCVGCLIKCSFPLVVECVSAFCRPVPQCLLQSTHMVCLSVYDFSYTGVVRFLNHLSTRGRAVHI